MHISGVTGQEKDKLSNSSGVVPGEAKKATQDAAQKQDSTNTDIKQAEESQEKGAKEDRHEKIAAITNTTVRTANETDTNPSTPLSQNTSSVDTSQEGFTEDEAKLLPDTLEGKIEAILRKQRKILAKSMKGYIFHPKLKAR